MLGASKSILRSSRAFTRRNLATKSILEADSGPLGQRVHHTMTVVLGVAAPIYFAVPDAYTDGLFNKLFGVALAANFTAHSWIGMNYVCVDYIPKFSKALLGPARYVNAFMAVVTFLGMSKIALTSPGGIKGVVKGLWNPKPKKEVEF